MNAHDLPFPALLWVSHLCIQLSSHSRLELFKSLLKQRVQTKFHLFLLSPGNSYAIRIWVKVECGVMAVLGVIVCESWDGRGGCPCVRRQYEAAEDVSTEVTWAGWADSHPLAHTGCALWPEHLQWKWKVCFLLRVAGGVRQSVRF